MPTERWVVGPEHDETKFLHLGVVLRELGFDLGAKWDGLAGSQELHHWVVHSASGELTIESETYVGLSLEGPVELVQLVRQRFQASNAF